MFKKPVKVSAQNQLSGKDKKVIKSKISQSLDNECVEKILAANEKMICCKISGSKMLIYNGEQYPIFVDGTGKNNYFPSLYIAIAYQPLIKSLIINEGVEAYIFNGANLMWPGVRSYEGLGEFSKDETVGIRNSKGEMIAIGAMGCGKKDLTDTSGVAVYILHYLGDKLWEMGPKTSPQIIVPLKVEQKKQEVKQQPKKEEPKKQEPAKVESKKAQEKGKKEETVKEKKDVKKKQKSPEPKKQKTPEASQESDEDDDDFMNLVHTKNQPKGRVIKMQQKPNIKNAFIEDENEQKNAKNKKKGQATHQQKPKQKGGKNKKQQSDEAQDVMEEEQEPQPKKGKKDNKKDTKKKGKDDKKGKKKQSEDQQDHEEKPHKENKQDKSDQEQKGQPEQKSAINSKLMDEYFKESMLNAIKLTKIQSELPIDSGRFYMDFMLLARPEGIKLDIKESSYKKIGKFFEEMAKKKIIEYKHPKDKKAQGAQITKIFWENEDVKNHAPTIKKLGSKQEEQKVQNYSKAKLKISKTVCLETVYKPSQDLFDEVLKKPLNLMPAEGQKQVTDKQEIEYVSEKELREKIERYINKITGADKKEDKKEKEKGQQKVEKTLLIEYNKFPYLKQLLKKQIEEYEESREKEQMLKAQEHSDDQQGGKKKKGKKGASKQCLKVERHYLVEKLMKKTSPYYHVYDKENDLDRFKEGTFKGIQITAEKVNNKNVTRISGLELFITPKDEADDQIHGFANALQTKFACSVNVQNLPGKNAGKEIIVHGAFLDELEDIFTQQHELPSKFISTLNKLDKKKKN